MPKYDFKCKRCQENFQIICGINDDRENIICPNCSGKETVRIYNATVLRKEHTKLNNPEQKEEIPEEAKASENKEAHDHHDHGHCSPELDYL